MLRPRILSQAQLWKGFVEMPCMQVSSKQSHRLQPKSRSMIMHVKYFSKPALLEGLEVDQFMWSIIQVPMFPNSKIVLYAHCVSCTDELFAIQSNWCEKCKFYDSGDGEELLRELTNTLKHKYHQDAYIVPISALVLQRGWGGAGGQSGQCQANLPQDGGRNQPGHCSIFILLKVIKIIFSRMWNQSWRARSRWQAWAPGSSPTQSLLRSMLLQIWTVSAF